MNHETKDDLELEAATPFIFMKDAKEDARKDTLAVLKASASIIGFISGIACQSLSWATHFAIAKTLGIEGASKWLDLLCTLVSLFILPMVVLEVLRIAFLGVAQLASARIDEAVFYRLFLHFQLRFGIGVLCGVLMTIPLLNFPLELAHHLLYVVTLLGLVTFWCGFLEKRVMDESSTISLSSRLKDEDPGPGPAESVF